MTVKLSKAEEFRKNSMAGFVKAIIAEIERVDKEMSELPPDAMKDPNIRKEIMDLMVEISRGKELVEAFHMAEERRLDIKTPANDDDERPVGKQPIGFMNFKKAA